MVITSRTRNAVIGFPVHGFESHPLRLTGELQRQFPLFFIQETAMKKLVTTICALVLVFSFFLPVNVYASDPLTGYMTNWPYM